MQKKTYIDFDKLRRERTEDIFAFPPIDIRDSVQLMAEIVRDHTRQNAKAMQAAGEGMSRVEVEDPSPRLRQRLAVLGWLPVDPATDDVWYLDEAVELHSSDKHVVAVRVLTRFDVTEKAPRSRRSAETIAVTAIVGPMSFSFQ